MMISSRLLLTLLHSNPPDVSFKADIKAEKLRQERLAKIQALTRDDDDVDPKKGTKQANQPPQADADPATRAKRLNKKLKDIELLEVLYDISRYDMLMDHVSHSSDL